METMVESVIGMMRILGGGGKGTKVIFVNTKLDKYKKHSRKHIISKL